jgi:aspartyl-tRNA(Asn)/glutamyl-tRNA(Gln) amidotransferase subunit B
LLPLEFDQAFVDELAGDLPELPDAKMTRLIAQYGITADDAAVLSSEMEIANYFEGTATDRDGKLAANWVINELLGALNKQNLSIGESPLSAVQLGQIIWLISDKTISGKIAKDLFEIVWSEGGDPLELVESRGMKQVTDSGAIEKMVDDVIAGNPDKVAQAIEKPAMLGWFVGQVMKASGGKANPQAVSEMLRQKIGL